MKELLKSDIFLKIALITGLLALFLIFLFSSGKRQTETNKGTGTEERLVVMISSLCKEEEPKVMIRTDKDGYTVLGVGIITKSADDPVIKEKILELTSKVLDVSPARICITT